MIHDKAYDLIAKKVSKQNGDIRVAFDLMKSALELLKSRIMADKSDSIALEKV